MILHGKKSKPAFQYLLWDLPEARCDEMIRSHAHLWFMAYFLGKTSTNYWGMDSRNENSLLVLFKQSNAQKHFFAYEGDWSPWTIEILDESDDWVWINDKTSESFKSFELSLGFYSGKHLVFKEYLGDLRKKSTLLLIEIENEFRNRSIQVPEPSIKPIFVLD